MLHDIFSSAVISINQTSASTIHVEVMNSFYPSLSTTPLVCDYSDCALLSSIECSAFISGYYNCFFCNTSRCTVRTNRHLELYPEMSFYNRSIPGVPFYHQSTILHPFLALYTRNTSHITSPSIFGCKEDGFCKWIHVFLPVCFEDRITQRRRVCTALSVFVHRFQKKKIRLNIFIFLFRSGMILLMYILLFNLPVILIIIYLLYHNHNAVKPEPIHFERKPLS